MYSMQKHGKLLLAIALSILILGSMLLLVINDNAAEDVSTVEDVTEAHTQEMSEDEIDEVPEAEERVRPFSFNLPGGWKEESSTSNSVTYGNGFSTFTVFFDVGDITDEQLGAEATYIDFIDPLPGDGLRMRGGSDYCWHWNTEGIDEFSETQGHDKLMAEYGGFKFTCILDTVPAKIGLYNSPEQVGVDVGGHNYYFEYTNSRVGFNQVEIDALLIGLALMP